MLTRVMMRSTFYIRISILVSSIFSFLHFTIVLIVITRSWKISLTAVFKTNFKQVPIVREEKERKLNENFTRLVLSSNLSKRTTSLLFFRDSSFRFYRFRPSSVFDRGFRLNQDRFLRTLRISFDYYSTLNEDLPSNLWDCLLVHCFHVEFELLEMNSTKLFSDQRAKPNQLNRLLISLVQHHRRQDRDSSTDRLCFEKILSAHRFYELTYWFLQQERSLFQMSWDSSSLHNSKFISIRFDVHRQVTYNKLTLFGLTITCSCGSEHSSLPDCLMFCFSFSADSISCNRIARSRSACERFSNSRCFSINSLTFLQRQRKQHTISNLAKPTNLTVEMPEQ